MASNRNFSISVDTGGTFTDVVVSNVVSGKITVGKSLTTYDRASVGLKNALSVAAQEIGITLEELLSRTSMFVYGTTRATNAIVERKSARTALLATRGFPDVLVLKEGGKFNAHQFDQPYPEPYIARSSTFEVDERIGSDGSVVKPIDRADLRELLSKLRDRNYQAIAVAFLWSTVNPSHELAAGELIRSMLPGVPFTLSHQINPIIREYRRASAAAIDASLKPLMQEHLRLLAEDLRGSGFDGDLLISTSFGGVLHISEVAQRPIFMVRSGPAMAPTAGLVTARAEDFGDNVIVCDTGGTTFDVTLVRDGSPKYTRETWLGPQFTGDCLGMASVDIRSIGAGGGSIAWVDSGGLLRVGPHSAGSNPGPACYGNGGTQATVTDAALVLGYLDADQFLGGRMKLNSDAARDAVEDVARRIKQPLQETAAAILAIANERMVKAIEEITVNEGVDPKESLLVAGGGAAGLNILSIARELGCTRVVIPKAAGALSAYGAQYSDIVVEFAASHFTRSGAFDFEGVNSALADLQLKLDQFGRTLTERGVGRNEISFVCEARYLFQVWEIDVPVPVNRFETQADLEAFIEAFHATHHRIFTVADRTQQVECLNWRGRLTAKLDTPPQAAVATGAAGEAKALSSRRAYFAGTGRVDTPAYLGSDLAPGTRIPGPAMILEPTTTIVVYPDASASVSGCGNYILDIGAGEGTTPNRTSFQ